MNDLAATFLGEEMTKDSVRLVSSYKINRLQYAKGAGQIFRIQSYALILAGTEPFIASLSKSMSSIS